MLQKPIVGILTGAVLGIIESFLFNGTWFSDWVWAVLF